MKQQYFRLGKRKLQPRIGRFYPRKFIAGFSDVYADDMRPMRLLSMDDSAMALDLNHPLSNMKQLTVAMRVTQWLEGGAEHGGRCNDPVMATLDDGPGYQAEMPQGRTDLFDDTAFERMAVVLAYFRDSGLFTDFYTETARGWPRPEDNRYAGKLTDSDPAFFVAANTNR